MKIKNLFLATTIIFSSQLCLGQEIPSSNLLEPKTPTEYKVATIQPYYILKADDKSVGIMSASNPKNDFDLKSIDNDLVSRLDVIQGQDATDQYGELGANGVIVVTFKSYASLPQELKDRFKDSEN